MEIAANLSVLSNYLDPEQRDRIVNLLRDMDLLTGFSISPDTFEKMLLADKKKNRNDVNFVLLESIGMARIEKIGISELVSLYKKIRGNNEG